MERYMHILSDGAILCASSLYVLRVCVYKGHSVNTLFKKNDFFSVCLFRFYGISIFVGYLMPNNFFIQINSSISKIQFSISALFHFYFNLFRLVKQF